MAAPVFGSVAPCRACHGAGERVYKMTDEEQRAHDREKRRAKRAGEDMPRASLTKPCPDCDGRGYLPPKVADAFTGPIR